MASTEAQIKKLESILAPQQGQAIEIKIPNAAALGLLGTYFQLCDELDRVTAVSKPLVARRVEIVRKNLIDMLAIVGDNNPEHSGFINEIVSSLTPQRQLQ